MIRFITLLLSLCSVLIISAVFLASRGMIPLPSQLWLIEAFLAATTTGIFWLLYSRPGGAAFAQLYLLSIVTKICLFGAFILIIIVRDPASAPANAVFFLITYMALTALEVSLLFQKFKPAKPSQKIK